MCVFEIFSRLGEVSYALLRYNLAFTSIVIQKNCILQLQICLFLNLIVLYSLLIYLASILFYLVLEEDLVKSDKLLGLKIDL